MFSKFGMHISSQGAINTGWVQKFQSPVHLILSTGIGGEIPRVQQVMDLCPNSLIVYRAWHYGWCESDHFESYQAKFGTDPYPLIDKHRACFDALDNKRVTYQFWNETGMTDEMWPYFVEFNTRLIQAMDSIGQSACIFGAGPGYPSGSRAVISAKWNIARPIFEAINAGTCPHYINLHEYFGYPTINYMDFLIGRYRWMLEDLDLMGLLTDKIKVIIGESSWCDPGALGLTPTSPANGYRGFLMQGITLHQLVVDLAGAYSQAYENNPHLVGTCHYCVGDSGGWGEFDLLNETAILQEIYNMADQYVVTDTENTEFKVVAEPGLNVRVAPSTDTAVVRKLLPGNVVVTTGFVDNDGYRWRRLEDGHFCAQYDLASLEKYLEAVVVPSWKQSVLVYLNDISDELDLIADRLSWIEDLINSN